jgi:hypothetical protein
VSAASTASAARQSPAAVPRATSAKALHLRDRMSGTTRWVDLTAGGGGAGAGRGGGAGAGAGRGTGAGAGARNGGGGGGTSSARCHRDGGAGRAGRPPFHEYHPPSALRPGSGPAVRDAARGGTYLAAAAWGCEETAAGVERGGGDSSRVGGKGGGGSAAAPWPGSGGE